VHHLQGAAKSSQTNHSRDGSTVKEFYVLLN